MNAIELLKADHERIDRLLGEIDSQEHYYEKKEIFQKVKAELETHSYLEENHFYPLLVNKPGFEDLIEDALDDHQEMKALLEEIDALEEDQEEFDERIGDLMDCVQSHIEMEEFEIFPKLGNMLSNEELDQLSAALNESRRSTEIAA